MKFATKLTLLFSGIVLVTFAATSYYGYTSYIRVLEALLRDKMEGLAFHTFEDLDAFIYERYSDIKTIAADPVISRRGSTAKQVTARLTQYLKESGDYASMSFFDMGRVRLADTGGKDIGVRQPFTEYWQEISKGSAAVVDVCLCEPPDETAIHFAAVVKDGVGRPFGVVVSSVPIARIHDVARPAAGTNGQEVHLDLVDRDGLTLYSNYNDKAILKDKAPGWGEVRRELLSGRRAGSGRRRDKGGDVIYAFMADPGYRDFKGSGWTLMLHMYGKEIFAPVTRLSKGMTKVYAAMYIAAFIAVLVFTRTVSRPLARLGKAADEISRGNLGQRVEVSSNDEIRLLADSFNKMAESLEEADGRLKVELAERGRAEAELSERARQAVLSAEVGTALVKGKTLRESLQVCAEAVVRNLDAAFARIWTLNEEDDVLELQASAGMYTHIDGAHSRVPVGQFKIGLIALERKPDLTNSVIGDPHVHNQEWAKKEGMVAFAGYPLLVGKKLVGVGAVFARMPLSDRALMALGSVADEIALGIERARMEYVQKESEEQHRVLFELSPDAILLLGLDFGISNVNQQCMELLGFGAADQLIGKNVMDFVVPEDRPLIADEVNRMFKTGGLGRVEVKAMRRDGSMFACEAVGSLVMDAEGKPKSIISTIRDVTRRRDAEDAVREANLKLNEQVKELADRNEEIKMLGKMGELLQSCRTVEESYKVVARAARQLFPSSSGSLFVYKASRNMLDSTASWGEGRMEMDTIAPEECWALRRGRMHVVSGFSTDPPCDWAKEQGASICVPILARGEVLGVLRVMFDPNDAALGNSQLFQTKQRLARNVCEQVGLSLANLRLRDTMRDMSIRDVLTGLFNRRHMDESFERELARAGRNGTPVSVIMIDIDHFKRFNDTFGHEAGDVLLKELGGFLRQRVRGSDIACRYGGEEFTVILPDAALDAARKRAEEIGEAVKRIRLNYGPAPLGVITVSLGVAAYPEHGLTSEEVLRAADAALYRAKAAGRDRVCTAEKDAGHKGGRAA